MTGRVAVLTLTGSYSGLAAAWDWLYATWLPASGEAPSDGPAWEEYPNSPANTAEPALITRICGPVRG